jgi:UDPglucose 6-dehydrogenase
LWVAGQLHLRGAQVTVYDPRAHHTASAMFPTLDYADSAIAAAADADLLLHLTEWKEFRTVDLEALAQTVRRKQMIDGRNALDLDAWRAAGWTARGMGRR